MELFFLFWFVKVGQHGKTVKSQEPYERAALHQGLIYVLRRHPQTTYETQQRSQEPSRKRRFVEEHSCLMLLGNI